MRYSSTKILRDYGITIGLAISVALFIRSYGIEAYRIPSITMKPTLLPGDIIFAAKWPFKITHYTPKRGDVIVFEDLNAPGSNFIKRIIGLPKDQIQIRRGLVYLNGTKLVTTQTDNPQCLKEQLPEGKTYSVCLEMPSLETDGVKTVPPNSVFVMSDLRGGASVSKSKTPSDAQKFADWGIVPLSSLNGKALWIWLSVEPNQEFGKNSGWFPRLRFHRMFQEIL